MGKVIVILAFGIMAGCQSVPRSTFCDVARPIRLSEATIAVMTDAEVSEALALNKKGEALCGWRP